MDKNLKKWDWAKTPPLGGAAGGIFGKVFKGVSELESSDLLARELIQNSVDANTKLKLTEETDVPLKVVFRYIELTGREKKKFIEDFDFRNLHARTKIMSEKMKNQAELGFRDILNNDMPLKLLICEDFGAHGLYGDIKEQSNSVLFRALYNFGDTNKGNDSGAGGSYGFGKSAFIRTSSIHTVFAYSSFKPIKNDRVLKDDTVTRRAVGFSYWDNFSDNGANYDGRAIFSATNKSTGIPFEDDEADDLALKMHIKKRNAHPLHNLGTSLLIVQPNVSPEELKKAIEMWWWPAIIEKKLEVEIVKNNKIKFVPDPENNPNLANFIKSYRIAKSTAVALENDTTFHKYEIKNKNMSIGNLVLVNDLNPKNKENLEKPVVATMRSPLMVVEYIEFPSYKVKIRGVFVASASADKYLKETEPAQHNKWYGKTEKDAIEFEVVSAKIAKKVNTEISKNVGDYIKTLTPEEEESNVSLNMLASLLKGFQVPSKGKQTPPKTDKLPIQIKYLRDPVIKEGVLKGTIYAVTEVEISLADPSIKEVFDIECSFNWFFVADETEKGEKIPSQEVIKSGRSILQFGESKEKIQLSGKSKIVAYSRTSDYEMTFTAMFDPSFKILDNKLRLDTEND